MSPYKILLVDDNPLSLKLLRAIFDSQDYEPYTATDGADAMTILLNNKVDLIITDVLMPNVDGYYLCYKVRMHQQLRNIPIIVYSGTFTSQSEEKVAKDMGADLFIRKPASKNSLLTAAQTLLSNPQNIIHEVLTRPASSEVMLQYNSSLIDKLEQRSFMLEEAKQNLERTVEVRTHELKKTNEELQAVNEELQAANEELTTLNDQLSAASEVIQQQSQIIISQKDELLNRVYDTVADILFVLEVQENMRYKITSVNRAFEIATGTKAHEVVGGWMDEVTPTRLFNSMLGQFKLAIVTRKTIKWEEKINLTPGKLVGDISVTPVFDKKGNCIQLIGAVHDITERKKFEERLKHSESRLKEAQTIAHIGNWEVDLINIKHWWSDEVYRIYGIEKGEVSPTAETFLSFVHPEDADQATKIITQTFSTITNTVLNFRFIKKGGEIRYGYSESRYEFDEAGKPIRLFGIIQDITEKKRAEQKILESEKRYRETLDNMIEGCQIIDFNWRYVYVNPSAAKQGQKIPKNLIGKTMMEAYPGIESTKLFATLKHCMQARTEEQFENQFNQPDGSTGWFDLRIQPSPEGLFIVSSDISERKKAEQFLQAYNERYSIVSKATNDAIWDWDMVNDIEVWNHGMQTIFGYSEREIHSTKIWWEKKIHPDDYIQVSHVQEQAIEKNENNWNCQYRYRCADGSYKNVFDRAYIIYENNKPVRMIGAMQDITEVVQYRESLERMVEERTRKLNKALKKEKELVEMKSKFISIASHEFRTPLSTIALATGFIKKYNKKISASDLDEKLSGIEKQVSHMTYLLDDVLTVGKVEAGKIEVVPTEIKIDFFKKLGEEVFSTSGTSHKLQYHQDCSITQITSSEKLIRNIIVNLLTNAIKFSPGKKEVRMTLTCDKRNIYVTIKDMGVGIPAKDKKNLFTSFTRGSNVSTIEGTGLGLSIVKKAIDLLNGTIAVSSKINQGTEFKVTLPIHHE